MSELSEILGTLLLRNNCVVIPSFGGFVANVVSAEIDVVKGVIIPPRKALSFNRNLNNNDGLLISTFASENEISFDEASSIISSQVVQIKSQLSKGKRVQFQNVGFLYINKAGNIAFEQDRFFNLLLSSYGLGNIQFISEETTVTESAPGKEKKPVAKVISLVEPSPVKEKEQDQTEENKVHKLSPSFVEQPEIKKEEPKPKTKILKQIAKYAAVAAIVPLAFYSFWIPLNTDVLQSGVVYTDDFNPFLEKGNSQYSSRFKKEPLTIDSAEHLESLSAMTDHLSENTRIFSYPLDDDLYIPVRLENKTTSEAKNGSVSESVSSDARPTSGYHVIVGCFSEKDNAESMVESLKNDGFDGMILDYHNGLHRVSAANVKNKKTALEKRERIKSQGFSTWILKK